MSNGALRANPPNAAIDITTHASDWLWAVFAVMLVSDLIFVFWTFTLPRGLRVFHQVPIAILTTAAIAYFAMASDLGSTPIATEFSRGRQPGISRAIWYVRYIDWTITTPLLLLEILFGTGLSLSEIFTVVFMDLVMIVCGLVGALVASSYKWGFFAFGCAALFYIWWVLVGHAPAAALVLGGDVRRVYTRSAFYLSFIWMLYPICWGLSDGGNVISPTGEMIFYGILDILAKPVFCFLHVSSLRSIDYSRFGLTSGKASEFTAARGLAMGEKGRHFEGAGTGAGVGSGVGNTGTTSGVAGTGTGVAGTGGPGVGGVGTGGQATR